jgi:hypothetical protein
LLGLVVGGLLLTLLRAGRVHKAALAAVVVAVAQELPEALGVEVVPA